MTQMIQKFIQIGKHHIFYRMMGQGPFLVLLHPSPRNSAMMVPMMHLLADHFTVIAPDTPGYGFSEANENTPEDISDYTLFIDVIVREVCRGKTRIYGTATGAQLAIAYALEHPEKVLHIYADNAAHFDVKQREEILANYFIDISPQANGSHLSKLWNHIMDSCLFFPWYDKKETNRFANELPSDAVMQTILTDYLLAGNNYAAAYKVAFKHEDIKNVEALKVNTTLFRWMGSPILKYIDQLLSHQLPSNIQIVETPVSIPERYAVMKSTMIEST
jgi:pimeloyl-ACP methyl ester carboxylesterase